MSNASIENANRALREASASPASGGGAARFILELLTLIIVLVMLFVYTALAQWEHEAKVQRSLTTPSAKQFAAAHAFHGILASYLDDGEWVFWREGKRCQLFAYKEGRP